MRCRWLYQFVLLVIVVTPVPIDAADQCNNPWVAKIVSIQGQVEISRAGKAQWYRALLNDTFCADDRLRYVTTPAGSSVNFSIKPRVGVIRASLLPYANAKRLKATHLKANCSNWSTMTTSVTSPRSL